MAKGSTMSRPLYKRIVSQAEKESNAYSKLLRVSIRAFAKSLIKELRIKPKLISPMSTAADGRRVYVTIESHSPIDMTLLDEVKKALQKHSRFVQLFPTDDKSFSIYMYAIQPFAYKPGE